MVYPAVYSLNRQGGSTQALPAACARRYEPWLIILLVCVLGACTTVGQIQQTEPIRRLTFTGPHTAVAKCVQQRVGGKVRDEAFGERFVIYDSVKGKQAEGLTHYAITVGKLDADRGFAEWRIMRPARGPGPGQPPVPRLASEVIQQYWNPVLDCAAQR